MTRIHHHVRLMSILALVIMLLPLVLAGCGRPSATTAGQQVAPPATGAVEQAAPSVFPMTVTDDVGRQVQVTAAPKRIVSAAPSTTEILFALGLDEQVAAVTNFCNYPEAAAQKPKIGGLRPNMEAIVAQQPDLVLAVRGTPPDIIAALEVQRVPVVILNPATFDGVLQNIRLVGQITGATTAAERLTSQMQQRWNAVAEKAKNAPKVRVLYEVDATDPASITVAGPGTFIDAMIAASGGENVLAALTPGQQYPRVNAEVVIQANPQLIILGNAAFGQSLESVSRRPGWTVLDAVQRGAVAPMADPDIVSRAGPRLVDGLEAVARAIHPEIFR